MVGVAVGGGSAVTEDGLRIETQGIEASWVSLDKVKPGFTGESSPKDR